MYVELERGRKQHTRQPNRPCLPLTTSEQNVPACLQDPRDDKVFTERRSPPLSALLCLRMREAGLADPHRHPDPCCPSSSFAPSHSSIRLEHCSDLLASRVRSVRPCRSLRGPRRAEERRPRRVRSAGERSVEVRRTSLHETLW